jgi:phage-related protein
MLRLVLLEDGPAMQVHDLERNGRREAMDFIESLAAPAQSRFIKTFRQLAQTGRAGREEQRFKHLDGPVYEVKEHSVNARLFCFRWRDRVIVCTHGMRKPAGHGSRQYQEAIEKVKRLLEECEAAGVLP